MQAKDLTRECGFQSHQMTLRHYIMERNLLRLKTDVNDYNGFFHHFARSPSNVNDTGPLHTVASKKNKAQLFVDIATSSLHKHFSRWTSQDLIPAAMMSEAPIAAVLSRVIRGDPAPWPEPPESKFDASVDYIGIDRVNDPNDR